MAISRKEQGK